MEPRAILLPGAVMPADPAYGALLDALGGGVRAIAKELEVYAGPEPPPGYTLGHEVEGVLRAAGDAGFETFHLVGYSAGGAAAVAFAGAHPERLASLALLEPAWLGNDGLSSEERALRREFERIATLPAEEMMPAFVRTQLAPGVEPPAPPPGPTPPWMATRPAGIRTITAAFDDATLDVERLRAFDRPVYFALGARSNPDYYGGWPSERPGSSRASRSTSSTNATTSTRRIASSRSAPRARCSPSGRAPSPDARGADTISPARPEEIDRAERERVAGGRTM